MNRSPSASSVSAMLSVTNSRARAELYASTSREDARVSQAEAQHYLLKKFGLDIDAEFVARLWEEEELECSAGKVQLA